MPKTKFIVLALGPLTGVDDIDTCQGSCTAEDMAIPVTALEPSTLRALRELFDAQIENTDDEDTDDEDNILTPSNASEDGLLFSTDDEGIVDGPTYSAEELRIIGTHAIVALASGVGVDDAIRWQAAGALREHADKLATH